MASALSPPWASRDEIRPDLHAAVLSRKIMQADTGTADDQRLSAGVLPQGVATGAGRRCRRGAMMTELPITYRGTIYPWHCDHVGHMNVMWYVGKFDEATWHFFNLLGLSPTFLRTAKRGMAAVEQHISY